MPEHEHNRGRIVRSGARESRRWISARRARRCADVTSASSASRSDSARDEREIVDEEARGRREPLGHERVRLGELGRASIAALASSPRETRPATMASSSASRSSVIAPAGPVSLRAEARRARAAWMKRLVSARRSSPASSAAPGSAWSQREGLAKAQHEVRGDAHSAKDITPVTALDEIDVRTAVRAARAANPSRPILLEPNAMVKLRRHDVDESLFPELRGEHQHMSE